MRVVAEVFERLHRSRHSNRGTSCRTLGTPSPLCLKPRPRGADGRIALSLVPVKAHSLSGSEAGPGKGRKKGLDRARVATQKY